VDPIRPVTPGAPSAEGAPGGPALAELLRLASRGDQGAFAELYDATSRRAFGLAAAGGA
jgi:RNA polymerase sigma-70 factor (ECF subfamily)